MTMLQSSLPWSEPLDLAAGLATSGYEHWVLLYSGVQTSYSGRYSILAYDMKDCVQGNDFASLSAKLSSDKPRYENSWLGYLGYGLKNSVEELSRDSVNWPTLAPLCMMQFRTLLVFDHALRGITLWTESEQPYIPIPPAVDTIYPVRVNEISSNMQRQSYIDKVKTILAKIAAGDLYQANLTRKFMGCFNEIPSPFQLFRKLCDVSPAPYSAFIRIKDDYILSSSPELFLNIDEQGHIRTRPIKGTAARFADPAQDNASAQQLSRSDKDRAENLMIVDLMRNDLSRSCVAGSVKTPALFEVTSHATIHHMSSTITGQMRKDCSTLDTIKYCFPPGSMTGAPKIKAMELCSQLEQLERGIYSGAIGWLGGDGACELSVVIRTILIQGKQFEFQVGGGIVADSVPELELQETVDKAKGILNCLGLGNDDIVNL